MGTETKFQKELKERISKELPGSIVTKLDPNQIQGIPDLLVLFGKKWATLEVKKSKDAPHRPNQDFYVDKMNSMSFSEFVYPENVEFIIEKLKQFFKK